MKNYELTISEYNRIEDQFNTKKNEIDKEYPDYEFDIINDIIGNIFNIDGKVLGHIVDTYYKHELENPNSNVFICDLEDYIKYCHYVAYTIDRDTNK